MEETLQKIYELLKDEKESQINYDNCTFELLTFKQLSERTGINENAFQKQAQFDDDFPVQKWTVPFRVSWTAFLEYCKKKH